MTACVRGLRMPAVCGNHSVYFALCNPETGMHPEHRGKPGTSADSQATATETEFVF